MTSRRYEERVVYVTDDACGRLRCEGCEDGGKGGERRGGSNQHSRYEVSALGSRPDGYVEQEARESEGCECTTEGQHDSIMRRSKRDSGGLWDMRDDSEDADTKATETAGGDVWSTVWL